MISLHQRSFSTVALFAGFTQAVYPRSSNKSFVAQVQEFYNLLDLGTYSSKDLTARLRHGYDNNFHCRIKGVTYTCTSSNFDAALAEVQTNHLADLKLWFLSKQSDGYRAQLTQEQRDQFNAKVMRKILAATGYAVAGYYVGVPIGGFIGGALGTAAGNPIKGAEIGSWLGAAVVGAVSSVFISKVTSERHTEAFARAIRTRELSWPHLRTYFELHMT